MLVAIGIEGVHLSHTGAAPPGAAPLDAAAVRAIVREEIARLEADSRTTSARVALIEELVMKHTQLLGRLDEMGGEGRPSSGAAAKPAQVVRVVPLEARFLCRVRLGASGGLEWRALPLGGPEQGPFAAGDEAALAGGAWTPLPAGERTARIPVPLEGAALEAGVLFASAILRAEKDVGEDQGAPNRLWLACTDAAGARRLWDLAGQFTPARGAQRDALLKVSANTAAFAVGPGSRLEVVLDADALARRLAGTLDIYVRQGPLLAVPPAPEEKKP